MTGLWDFGYSETEKIPVCDAVAAVPVCADALAEHFGREGYAAFRRQVQIGGMVRLRVTGGLHVRVFWDGREVGESRLAYTREEYDFDAGGENGHTLLIVTVITMGAAIGSYILVSLFGPKHVHNMDKLLHRGEYAEADTRTASAPENFPGRSSSASRRSIRSRKRSWSIHRFTTRWACSSCFSS